MRYTVQRYFSRNGWVVRGFEPHAIAANISQETDSSQVLHSKLPEYIRTALEEKFAHSGFSLEDLVVMVAAIERLVFDEVTRGIELAFKLTRHAIVDGLDFNAFTDVLGSYLITEMFEGTSNEFEQHTQDKENIDELYPHWNTTSKFLMDLVLSEDFAKMPRRNPFIDHGKYYFDDATRVGQQISE